MKIKQFPYRLGLLIPVTIIALNGLSAYYSVFRFDSFRARISFLIAYALVWITYILAVTVSPGYTDGHIEKGGLYVQCSKCNLPKPERAHHCKTCGRCVLRMDHHCRWTENCVGFKNIGHFVRFLLSTSLLTGYGLCRTASFLIYAFNNRGRLRYLIPDKTSRILLASFSVVSNFLVCLTLSLLLLRVFFDTANGQTQIENWEQERNYILSRRKLAAKVDFPFDIDYFSNLFNTFGPIYEWPVLWGGPHGSGHTFEKIVYDEDRWPPSESAEVQAHDFYRRDKWISTEGEQFEDFGIDEESDKPVDDEDTPLSNFINSKKDQ